MGLSMFELQPRFAALFEGMPDAFGYNSSPPRWVKRPPRPEDWYEHLTAKSPGIGIAPLCPDNHVRFAAIDLDEADFDAAREMQGYIPGPSFVERSKSGNAHVWVFFESPLEAWVAMGILKLATTAAGKEHVEVFPKNYDFERVTLGNYINLPYHGSDRPILIEPDENLLIPGEKKPTEPLVPIGLPLFLDLAERSKNDPREWRKRATYMGIESPATRERTSEFGEQSRLHICAKHVIENAHTNPVVAGHRAVVFFVLAKALTNWRDCDHDEALEFMRSVNDESPHPVDEYELNRILRNVEEKQYTSTGCDDPTFAPYRHPDCRIGR